MLWLALEIEILFELNSPKYQSCNVHQFYKVSNFTNQLVCARSAPPPHCLLALPPARKPRSGTAISIETSVGEYTKGGRGTMTVAT